MSTTDQLVWFYYVVIPYLTLCFVIALILCGITYKQLWFNPSKAYSNKIQNAFRYTQTICVTASMCGIGMDLSRFIISGFI